MKNLTKRLTYCLIGLTSLACNPHNTQHNNYTKNNPSLVSACDSLDATLKTPKGTLEELSELKNFNTSRQAYEIFDERIKNNNLLSSGFWTEDFVFYKMKDKKDVSIYLANKENNLLSKNITDAIKQIRTHDNYFPNTTELERVINDTNTIEVSIPELNTTKYNDEWSFYEICTKNPDMTNHARNSVNKVIFGKNFDKDMKLLDSIGISHMKVYVLNQDYVREILSDNSSNAISRPVFLYNNSISSEIFSRHNYRVMLGSKFIDLHNRHILVEP